MKTAFLTRRSRRLLVLATLLAAGAVVFMQIQSRRVADPIREGKHLSEWLVMWGIPRDKTPQKVQDHAAEVIRSFGSNAVPSLLAWMDYEAPLARHPTVTRLAFRLPRKFFTSYPIRKLLDSRTEERRAQNAMDALVLLGPDADCAVPELIRRVTTSRLRTGRDRATCALCRFGRPAVPAMAESLRRDQVGDVWLMGCLSTLGTNAVSLIPILIQNLKHTNAFVAMINVRTLGDLKLEPDLTVPALIRGLEDPRREVRMESPRALGEFGGVASPALEALTNALSDPDLDVRQNSTNAIRVIAAQAATNASTQ